MAADLNLTLNGTPVPVYLGENATLALAQAIRAEAAADAAAASEAVALAAAGPNYADTAAGLAATSEGETFAVEDDGIVTVYRHDSGPTATELRVLPTTAALASTDPGKGASFSKLENGMDVQQALGHLSTTSTSPGPSAGTAKKAFFRRAQFTTVHLGTKGSRYWCCVPKSNRAGTRYLMFELRRGDLGPSGSVGENAELLRVTSIWEVVKAWIGRHTYADTSDAGHWTETAYTVSGYGTVYSQGQDVHKYWSSASDASSADRWIEFTVPFNTDGEANLQFLSTPGSDTAAEIQIDGGTAEVVNLSAVANAIYRHKLRATPGNHTVRITKKTALSAINVFGSNYGELATYPEFAFPGGFAAWGDATTGSPGGATFDGTAYTSGEGANDYAILDDASGLFAGSFHGGEVLLAERYIMDGTPTDPLGNINICETLEILQKTQIDWPDNETPTSSLIVHSTIRFAENSGFSMEYTFSENPDVPGGVSSKTFFTTMHTTPERFSEILAPDYVDLDGASDGFKTMTRSNVVVQYDPDAGERIITEMALFNDDYGNAYGGPSVRKVTGSYNKLYYGPVVDANEARTFTRLRASFRRFFV